MAHQCWNDGTDRSALPIHGTSSIGFITSEPVMVSTLHPIFFLIPVRRFASNLIAV
jgi:hypothetical protein